MSRNRNRDEQEQPMGQPVQGNQVYGTSPQQVSPNAPNTSQTVSPVIIYAYPPHMAPQAPQAQAPQQASSNNNNNDNNNGGGCPCSGNRCERPRKKRRLLKFLLFVGVIWFTATMAYRHGGKVVKMIALGKIAKEIDLTHHQKHQLRGIFFETMHKNRKHRGTALKIRHEFMQLMAKPNLKQKELDAFLLKTTGTIQKIILSNSKNLYKAHNVLSPGQRHILMARLQQMHNRRHRRHRRHHRHHRRGLHFRYSSDTEAPKAAKAAKAVKTTKAAAPAKVAAPAKAAAPTKAPAPAKAAPASPAPIVW